MTLVLNYLLALSLKSALQIVTWQRVVMKELSQKDLLRLWLQLQKGFLLKAIAPWRFQRE
jgi:hypothetical protein